MFSELFAPVSIGVRTIAKTVRILERNQPERKKAKASQLLMDNRCSYIAPTDYSPEKKLENLAFGIIDLIAAQENLNKLVEKKSLAKRDKAFKFALSIEQGM